MNISRRTYLQSLAAAAVGCQALAAARPRTALGLVIYDCGIRRRWLRKARPDFDLYAPQNFLQHCQSLGAGGMQAALGILNAEDVRPLREFAEQHGLFIEAIIRPPNDGADMARFEAEMRTAVQAGATAARTVVMPGRRYEQFRSLEEFQQAAERAQRLLERARPVVERFRMPLAVENHKDQRIEERVALFQRLNCEYIGACVDTGNSMALLDDPYQSVEALATYAFSVHLKDQALQAYDDGFLLGDIPLGQGSFDLPRMVATIRRIKPDVHFSLELITRDPLRVPCLTDDYWQTMPNVPGRDLARTLNFVKQHTVTELQAVSTLSKEAQVALEDSNVSVSLSYARERLGL